MSWQGRVTTAVAATLLAAALGGTGSAAGTASVPAPMALFQAFQDLCLKTDGDAARAIAAAQAAGWSVPTAAEMLPLDALSMGDGQQRAMQAASARLNLAVGHALDPAQLGAGPTPWRVCIVTRDPVDPAAAGALQAWAGVTPMRAPEAAASALFVTTGPPAARRSVDGLSDLAIHALVQADDIIAAGVKTAGSSTILLYARPGG